MGPRPARRDSGVRDDAPLLVALGLGYLCQPVNLGLAQLENALVALALGLLAPGALGLAPAASAAVERALGRRASPGR